MDLTIHHHVIDRLAFLNGFASGIALYPQVWSVLTSHSIVGVSSLTFTIILLNSLVWLLYAIHRGLISLGIASLLNSIASAILIASIALF